MHNRITINRMIVIKRRKMIGGSNLRTKRVLFIFIILSIFTYIYIFEMQDDIFPDYSVDDDIVDKIILENIRSDMSEYEKVLAIHDYIVLSTTYDIKNLNNNTIPDLDYTAKGVLENKIGVCRGYSEAFKLLMDKLGIECEIMTGRADGVSHAWNVVKIDNKWYQIDCTYDDPLDNEDSEGESDNLRYDYFLITDDQMYIDHTPDKDSKSYDCFYEDYMYMEKVPGVPYYILKNIHLIPNALIQVVDSGTRSVTFYFPDNMDFENSGISDEIATSLGRNKTSFSTFSYTPVAKCGKYYYSTISVQ